MTNNPKLVSHNFMLTMKTGESHPQNVSRETFAMLREYVSLLLKWNSAINLIGSTTESDIWTRHIEDSLQLVPLIPEAASTLADLGSGAGLPGLVIAIARPELSVTLIEQDQRKAAFLNETKARLRLDNVTIVISDVARVAGQFDLVVARALAPLDSLCRMSKPLLNKEGICLFPKGQAYLQELEAARHNWQFDCVQNQSTTQENSSIVTISKLTSIRP